MLTITEDDAHHALIVEPSGELTADDFSRLSERFETMAHADDRPPSLVIHAKAFPGWANFAAFLDHVRFIREHHRRIGKIALVSDATILHLAPHLARHFVWADIRRFPEHALAEALDWVATTADPGGQAVLMTGLPDDVLGLDLRGAITARDYADTIVPAVERMLARHRKIKLIYRIGPEFTSVTPGAMWSDARVGLSHLSAFSRIAVVSDKEWVRLATQAFAPLIPGEVHIFPADKLDEAKDWIATPEPADAPADTTGTS
ncbi:STAS/SEC14 domain-containing protein [Acuticoccus kandeliae]|uniref:STAS/SEC14 domain-containing protein n=1 Tax=Acuticoccus kandeliae TaxID=2073160 RepID=UPI001474814C|nr:STAS/SEC14 domain-containing protein [Acuticoccus kandeliae]